MYNWQLRMKIPLQTWIATVVLGSGGRHATSTASPNQPTWRNRHRSEVRAHAGLEWVQDVTCGVARQVVNMFLMMCYFSREASTQHGSHLITLHTRVTAHFVCWVQTGPCTASERGAVYSQHSAAGNRPVQTSHPAQPRETPPHTSENAPQTCLISSRAAPWFCPTIDQNSSWSCRVFRHPSRANWFCSAAINLGQTILPSGATRSHTVKCRGGRKLSSAVKRESQQGYGEGKRNGEKRQEEINEWLDS
ncbi:hypothetical protein JZ751_011092 [Albula glossodonta]|uniref:Uncharacterized protein n=1 Tax=Albula glossodonta TaxID=121402 RepID=A0A8T2P464_9TELE|nr:hypothetical protein JZ751_011092 [Albula glossodonta]